jgi:RNA polymerase sigma-70 factor (ECF subfamily)
MTKRDDFSENSAESQPSSGTSRSLLARVQADEPDAWQRFVHLYAPLVLHWCQCRGLQGQDSADIFQDVFRSVVSHVGRFRKQQDGDTLRGWLRRITQNKIRDHFRRLAREIRGVGGSSALERLTQLPEATFIDHEIAPDNAAERSLFLRALDLIRDEFEPRTWQAFWHIVVDGRTAREAAEELGMSAGAVRVAKSRVLHRLREELGDVAD